MAKASKAKRKAVKKAQAHTWTPAARAKRKATWDAKRAARAAQAAAEFTAAPLPVAGEIPLHAIPARHKATPARVPARKAAPLHGAIVDPAETVQVIAGNFRITIERAK